MPEYEWVTADIFTVAEFFTRTECEEAIRRAESLGFSEAPINSAFGPRMRKDIRNNARVIIDDAIWAEELWRRAAVYVPQRREDWRAVGVNERLRCYRYDAGQQFDWHRDGYFERENGDRSHLTFMVYLNEGFEGGETSFEDTVVTPKQGTALFFTHRLLHKGELVVKGRKYAIRTDVMYRRAASSES